MLQLKTTEYSSHVELGIPGFNVSMLIVRNTGIRTKRDTGVTSAGFRVTGRAGIIRADLIVASVGRMMVNGSFTTPTPSSSSIRYEYRIGSIHRTRTMREYN